MGNNPILHNDPLGDTSRPMTAAELAASDQRFFELNKPGDNTNGVIHLPSKGEQDTHPGRALAKTVLFRIAELTPIKPLDEFFGTLFNGNSSATDLIKTGAYALLAGAGEGEGKGPVKAYEVGMTKDLKGRSVIGDDLSIHHAPQGKPSGQLIEGYDYSNAPGIVLPKSEHADIPTFRGENTAGSPRQ